MLSAILSKLWIFSTSVLSQILYNATMAYLGKKDAENQDVFARVEELVLRLWDEEMEGANKKLLVKTWIWEEWPLVKESVIDSAIQAIYTRTKETR